MKTPLADWQTHHPNCNRRRRTIGHTVATFRAVKALLPAVAEMEVSIVVYPDDRTFWMHRLRDWPSLKTAEEHRQFVDTEIRSALESEGASVQLVMFDPGSYARWRAANGITADTDTTRAAWAAEQP